MCLGKDFYEITHVSLWRRAEISLADRGGQRTAGLAVTNLMFADRYASPSVSLGFVLSSVSVTFYNLVEETSV